MGEPKDRRAPKKARTRNHLRTVAQRMFAEGGFDAVTIAEVAREADVAVQTVVNHFPTKEELFFGGRVPIPARRGGRPTDTGRPPARMRRAG